MQATFDIVSKESVYCVLLPPRAKVVSKKCQCDRCRTAPPMFTMHRDQGRTHNRAIEEAIAVADAPAELYGIRDVCHCRPYTMPVAREPNVIKHEFQQPGAFTPGGLG
jgi:hypothetical protein